MEQMMRESELSKEFQAYNKSETILRLTQEMDEATGGSFNWRMSLDCLMTTVCTGHEIPAAIDDALFDKAVAHTSKIFELNYNFKESQYSRLAMGPLLLDIKDRFNLAIVSEAGDRVYPKFVLYSGHDTTLMALLSAFKVFISGCGDVM